MQRPGPPAHAQHVRQRRCLRRRRERRAAAPGGVGRVADQSHRHVHVQRCAGRLGERLRQRGASARRGPPIGEVVRKGRLVGGPDPARSACDLFGFARRSARAGEPAARSGFGA
eukprot:360517-Chlamydomonas_euryale.AAC.8